MCLLNSGCVCFTPAKLYVLHIHAHAHAPTYVHSPVYPPIHLSIHLHLHREYLMKRASNWSTPFYSAPLDPTQRPLPSVPALYPSSAADFHLNFNGCSNPQNADADSCTATVLNNLNNLKAFKTKTDPNSSACVIYGHQFREGEGKIGWVVVIVKHVQMRGDILTCTNDRQTVHAPTPLSGVGGWDSEVSPLA